MKLSLSLLVACFPVFLFGQGITSPPSGGNQVSSVSQHIGLVEITIDYSSPGVTAPNGTDRRGQIWGQLVPYGMAPNGFGTASEIPWRAGSNMNTVFTTSHMIHVEGKDLAAGSYSVHIVPKEEGPWTIIFNKDIQSWGSYFYNPDMDALRIEVEPVPNEFHDDLTYEFEDRQQDHCTATLQWDELKIPFDISAPDMHDLYIATITEELKGSPGFSYQNWQAAANYCVQNNTHLETGLQWAEAAISAPFVGQKNFATLSTKASVLMTMGNMDEAMSVMDEAIRHPSADINSIHGFGRQLIGMGQKEKALEVFQFNAERFPNTWPVNVGLARGYSAVGDYKKALKHAKLAEENIPEGDTVNPASIASMIEKLGKDEDVN